MDNLQNEGFDMAALEAAIGYEFKNKALLIRALTHKSHSEEAKARGLELKDNQRLEYLGDAVLSLVMAERLIESLPDKQEGALSKWRASLVDGKSLAKKAKGIGLGSHLLLGKGEELTGGREKSKVLEDALEALLGAIYLDDGLEPAKKVTNGLFSEEFKGLKSGTLKQPPNFKGILQEYIQSQGGRLPGYRLVKTSGMDHEKHFWVEAHWNGRCIGKGEGNKKSRAEQAAAKDVLDNLRERLPEFSPPDGQKTRSL